MTELATGELLTRWTVRIAVALFVLGLSLRCRAYGRRYRLILARWAWTAGCVATLFHVACAFQFYHAWSHTAAYEQTARQTAEVTGLDWGGGVYANYAFLLVWLADVCWWWRNPESYQARRSGVEWLVLGFLGFIVFNATVVFGVGFIRWFGLAGCLLLAVQWGWQRRRLRTGAQKEAR